MSPQTPYGPGGSPLGPEGFFVAGEMPGAAFARYVPLLRGEIAGTVRALLPGASGAAPWLRAAVLTQMAIIPELLRTLEPAAAARHVSSATLTTQYLWPVWYELDQNGSAREPYARPGGAAAGSLPSDELRTVRDTAERQVSRLLGGYFPDDDEVGRLCERQARLVRTAALPPNTAPRPETGGWLLLAAVYALHGHPVLPRPGRRRRRLPWNRKPAALAGVAFEVGEAAALATALGLLRAAPRGG